MIIGTAIVLIALFPSQTASEVVAVDRLARLMEAESNTRQEVTPELKAALGATLVRSVRQLLAESGVEDEANIEDPAFLEGVRALVEEQLADLPLEAKARRKALRALLHRVTTRSLASTLVDGWFGLPPVASPAAETGAEIPAVVIDIVGGFLREVADAVQNPKLSTQDEVEPKSAPVARTASLPGAAQVRAAVVASGALGIDGEQVAITEDVGGAGAGNGLIDSQEWVRLQIPITNHGTLPWFSSSVRTSGDACLWVDSAPVLLAELPPGGAGAVDLFVYVAGDCATAERALVLQVDDTHRGTSGPLLRLVLTPMPAPRLRLENARLDTDVLGSSDGSKATVLGPKQRAEYSVDVVTDLRVANAREAFSVPSDLEGLFERFDHRAGASLIDDGKVLRAGDDVDMVLATADKFGAVASAQGTSGARWLMSGQQGKLWVAVDVTVDLALPVRQAVAIEAPVPTAATKARAKADSTAAGTVDADDIVALIDRHLTVVPHPDERALPNALRAFTGYEVVFDRVGFTQAYSALAHPSTVAAPTTPPTATATTAYTYRFYQALPTVALWAARANAIALDDGMESMEKTTTPVASRAPLVDERSWFRVDGGVGANVYTYAETARPFPTAAFLLRGLAGKDLAVVGSTSYAFARFDNLAGVSSISIDELEGEVGAAYRLWWLPFEVTPYVTAGVQQRWLFDPLGGERTPRLSLMGNLGVLGRIQISGIFGAYVDVGARLAEPGPAFDAVTVPGGTGLRANGGVSFTF